MKKSRYAKSEETSSRFYSYGRGPRFDRKKRDGLSRQVMAFGDQELSCPTWDGLYSPGTVERE